MERTWRFIQIAGLLALSGWWFSLASADEPKPDRSQPTRVALIDMARLFNGYPRFIEMREDLKLRIDIATAELEARTEALKGMHADLNKLPAGKAERRKLEREIRSVTARIEADKKHHTADFFQKEVGIYSACYQEVRAEIARYADAHGIQLVLRFTEPPPNRENEETARVKERLEAPFVYHGGLDITDEILAALR